MKNANEQLKAYYRKQCSFQDVRAAFKAIGYIKMQEEEGPYEFSLICAVLELLNYDIKTSARALSAACWYLHYSGFCQYLGVAS